MFQAFDFPDPAVANGDRVATTVASQSLFMMNGPLMKSAPEHLARSLLGRPGISDEDRLRDLCLRLFSRPAGGDELEGWAAFLERYQDAPSLASETPEDRRALAWRGLCRAMMSFNEFLYVE